MTYSRTYSVESPLLRRQVEVLYRMFEERQGDREMLGRIKELEAEANAIYGNHRSVVGGKKLEIRRVIAFEMQAHRHTADIDRPLSMEQMADDTVSALEQLGIENAGFFGFSMGAGIALQAAIRRPQVVRKFVLASVTYNEGGLHPGLMEGLAEMKPAMMYGSPWHEEYVRIAPRPEDFATLFVKKTQMDREIQDLPAETTKAIDAPTLLIIGDSDIVRPEHAVEMFRLLGGGVIGDLAGLPNSQLAILPAPLTRRSWSAAIGWVR